MIHSRFPRLSLDDKNFGEVDDDSNQISFIIQLFYLKLITIIK